MIKASTINTNEVTGEQIGRCHKCFEGSTAFYMVENERGDIDPETFEIIEYKVTHSIKNGFACTCWAGRDGFAHCGTKSQGICKHVVWSVAAAKEEREAIKLIESELAAEKEVTAAAEKAKSERIENNVPAWMLTGPVASHMSKAPRER
jgi:hypothetical protein